ncbi:MAG: hypothetical protein JRH10_07450 [Deltaproteobacteria bacterium]|nr:hypothetical protein [Deltaproteobacteria bacterium]MBW2448372.1 hypothetical protein [Deltaproteobacteria bacterium]
MAYADAFTIVCDHLERATVLERPAARGTVRLALKEAGLDPESVTPSQMAVVTEKLLPSELEALRITDVNGHCQSIRGRLKRLESDSSSSDASPEAVFERLATRSQ